jgi:hypothetical protein
MELYSHGNFEMYSRTTIPRCHDDTTQGGMMFCVIPEVHALRLWISSYVTATS